MKRVILFLIVVFIFGCSNQDSVSVNNQNSCKISVVENGLPYSEAKVMCIFSETEEAVISCDKNGVALADFEKPIKMIVAMAPGLSGMKKVVAQEKEFVVCLEKINNNQAEQEKLRATTWVVFQTISGGDVIFKYRGQKSYFFCSKYLPKIGEISPNPNDWNGWYLTDYLPVWEGWKLLVPQRYQYYHSIVYLQSISLSLRLVSNP